MCCLELRDFPLLLVWLLFNDIHSIDRLVNYFWKRIQLTRCLSAVYLLPGICPYSMAVSWLSSHA